MAHQHIRRPAILVALALCFMMPNAIAAAATPSDIMYAQPGRRIDVGGFRLNLRCVGTGKPTVIFDAGLGDWSPAWSTVQPIIARRTRACSYDRAGSGFSDAGPLPRTSARIASELHTLLQRAGERPPYVLVGHSFGSLNVRLFADRYLKDVAGIVLVDGSHEDQQSLMDPADMQSFEGGLATCEHAQRANRQPTIKERQTCAGLYFRGLPEKRFSAPLNAELEREALTAKQNQATRSEAQNFSTVSADEVRAAKRSYGSIPLRILTATNHFAPPTTKSAASIRQWEATWRALHRTWLPLSTDSRETPAVGSGHYIQFDRTTLVIQTIENVITEIRSKSPA